MASLLSTTPRASTTPAARDCAFIKRQTYDETPAAELAALDELASLVAAARVDDVADFYRATRALRLEGAERDSHSLISRDGERPRKESRAAVGRE